MGVGLVGKGGERDRDHLVQVITEYRTKNPYQQHSLYQLQSGYKHYLLLTILLLHFEKLTPPFTLQNILCKFQSTVSRKVRFGRMIFHPVIYQ